MNENETPVENKKNETKDIIKEAALSAVVTVVVTAGTTLVIGQVANFVNRRNAKKNEKTETE